MNTNEAESALDKIETLLLFGLDKAETIKPKWEKDSHVYNARSAIDLFRFDDRWPNRSYSFDPMDLSREFTADRELLLAHPSEIIGSGAETMFLNSENGCVKWMRIEPCRKPERGFAAIGRADKWYAAHYRFGSSAEGWKDYIKGYTAISKNGAPLLVKNMQCSKGIDLRKDSDQIIMMCSIIEDAHRTDSFLVSTKIESELLFPVGYDSYRSFFDLRDAPKNTPTGRRNPIVHWVASHLRETKSGANTEVKRHLRGVCEVEIDGIRATITPNDRDYVA